MKSPSVYASPPPLHPLSVYMTTRLRPIKLFPMKSMRKQNYFAFCIGGGKSSEQRHKRGKTCRRADRQASDRVRVRVPGMVIYGRNKLCDRKPCTILIFFHAMNIDC